MRLGANLVLLMYSIILISLTSFATVKLAVYYFSSPVPLLHLYQQPTITDVVAKDGHFELKGKLAGGGDFAILSKLQVEKGSQVTRAVVSDSIAVPYVHTAKTWVIWFSMKGEQLLSTEQRDEPSHMLGVGLFVVGVMVALKARQKLHQRIPKREEVISR